MRSNFILIWSLITALLTTACSSVPTATPDQTEREYLYGIKSAELKKAQWWALKGRLAVNDGKDGGSGHLNWLKRDQYSSMSFHGAFGRGAWKLNEDENGAVLEWSDGRVKRAESVAELVERQLGWKIPVNALAWWVRGLTAPGEWDLRQLDSHGNLKKLSQQGWDIEYGRYRDLGNVSMPVKVTARRQSYKVKFAIQFWDLNARVDQDD